MVVLHVHVVSKNHRHLRGLSAEVPVVRHLCRMDFAYDHDDKYVGVDAPDLFPIARRLDVADLLDQDSDSQYTLSDGNLTGVQGRVPDVPNAARCIHGVYVGELLAATDQSLVWHQLRNEGKELIVACDRAPDPDARLVPASVLLPLYWARRILDDRKP